MGNFTIKKKFNLATNILNFQDFTLKYIKIVGLPDKNGNISQQWATIYYLGTDETMLVLAFPFGLGEYPPAYHSLYHSLLFYLLLTFLLPVRFLGSYLGSVGSCLGTSSNCDLSLHGKVRNTRENSLALKKSHFHERYITDTLNLKAYYILII